MHIGNYLGLVDASEKDLAEAFVQVAEHHKDEVDVEQICKLLASWSRQHRQALQPFVARYSEVKGDEPDRMRRTLFDAPRNGSLALLRDLHDLWLLANEVDICWVVISQTALGLDDKELEACCSEMKKETKRQLAWLLTRIKMAATQTLMVAD